ncbi:lysostaphin resistance A-like protein [Liquorilactobacillus satsumensis]|uniref:CPBP family intramembrane glutamic endopeptidase n=1 Tax=Liquorilactobacillus satsumensis TaxID=259059 RepID=UPI0039EC430C
MKKQLLLIMVIIPIILGTTITSVIPVGIANSAGNVLGSIDVPLFELPFIFIYIAVIKLIWKFNFSFSLKNWFVPFMAIVSLLVTVFANIVTSKSLTVIFQKIPGGQILLAVLISLLAAIIIGLFEETVFRGVIFNYLFFIFRKTNRPVLFAGVLSSVIFGAVHLSNTLFGGGAEWGYTLYQVIYAAAIGFVFAMVYVKTKSLVIPIVLHALIDWSDLFFNLAGEPAMTGISWTPVILTIIYVVSGYMIYQTIEPNSFKSLGLKPE